MGFNKSLVLLTLPSPTFVGLMPLATLASVIAEFAISGLEAVHVKSPASLIFPLTSELASIVFEAST